MGIVVGYELHSAKAIPPRGNLGETEGRKTMNDLRLERIVTSMAKGGPTVEPQYPTL